MMNLSVFAATEGEVSSEVTPVLSSTTANSQNTSSTDSSSTTVSSVPYSNGEGLQLSDVLNILLIATGVVIILLAIAIFVKLK